jgi:UDP-3-O-[3-hydroxymyristoyl] N-acetylglucosamine deacetylase
MAQQSTIARRIPCRGIGLHSGEEVEITLCPADPGSGIVFVALGHGHGHGGNGSPGAGSNVEIPARVEAIHSSSRATTLALVPDELLSASVAENGASRRVATVEHLLATIFAFEIDNLRIEVSGSEIPAMDGSAAPFVDCLRRAGRTIQAGVRDEFSIDRPIEICEGDRSIRIDPAEELRISYAIDFDHPCIGRQSFDVTRLDEKVFERDLAPARTFGFAHEVEALHRAGLALGGRIENTLVLDDEKVLNEGGLRWPDEFVRHKVVDLIGDLALLGARPKAHIQVVRGGHRLHHRMVEALRASRAKPSIARNPRVPAPALPSAMDR